MQRREEQAGPSVAVRSAFWLRAVVSEYWRSYPEGNVHFYVETDRFCRFLEAKLASDRSIAAEVGPLLARDAATMAAALRDSQTEA